MASFFHRCFAHRLPVSGQAFFPEPHDRSRQLHPRRADRRLRQVGGLRGIGTGALRIAKALPELRWSNGGLLLLGVRKDGSIVGIDESAVDDIFDKFARLCGELSKASVEIGLLRIDAKLVVFLVFNIIPRHTDPLGRYAGDIERLAVV